MSATVSWEHFLPAIRVPSSEDKIFKDECPFHFETAESGDGLYVCLKHFIGVGATALRKYAASADSRVFLQYQIKRTFKNRDPSAEPHPTKLALGVPGGFDLPQDRYTVTEQWALVLLPQGERVEIPCPSEGSPLADISHLVPLGMPERLAKAVSIVQHAESALLLEERARNVEAWEDENIRPISSHSLELKQLDNGVRIAPSGWKCSSCDLRENLWLNLTDGSINCGRRFWDGSGGNNHAVEHYERSRYPLAVKLGTITAQVAGSVSHLLNAISLDEEHQHERAAILGVRAEASPLLEPNRSSQTSLDAFGSDSASYSSDYGADPLEGFELAQVSDLVPGIPIQSGETFAPLAAGVRGLVHGFVGGLTSMVTQPYKGIQEDQFKGFVTGFGRGLLGTVTKPLGGILDLVSGVMTTISEATRFSSNVQPRRRRPRRSGLSKYALLPLTVYHLDESVAQLQLHRLTLFTSARSAPKSSRRYTSPPSATSTEWLEIGEEVAVESEDSYAHPAESKEVMHALQSVSYAVHSTVDGAWLSHRFNYPECVFYVLPVQEAGVVAILTDRAIWCVSSQSLRGFVSSWPTDPNTPFERLPGPIFLLTEHATLMFMLPYHRLDHVRVKRSNFSSSIASSTSESVYVIFTGDSGVSAQQLRCDHTSWAVQLTKRTRETQFRFLQAAFSLFRPDLTLTPSAVNANPTGRSLRHGGVPMVPGYPVALAYAPVYR